jgi:hypothetical protein
VHAKNHAFSQDMLNAQAFNNCRAKLDTFLRSKIIILKTPCASYKSALILNLLYKQAFIYVFGARRCSRTAKKGMRRRMAGQIFAKICPHVRFAQAKRIRHRPLGDADCNERSELQYNKK